MEQCGDHDNLEIGQFRNPNPVRESQQYTKNIYVRDIYEIHRRVKFGAGCSQATKTMAHSRNQGYMVGVYAHPVTLNPSSHCNVEVTNSPQVTPRHA